MPKKNEKQLESVESVRCVERYKNYAGKDLWKDEFWAWNGREGVMDGDSGDEGNDELTCVRSDESDKSSWSAGRQSSLGSWFHRQGDVWRKEHLLTFREQEEGGWERVTTSEERVLRLGWTEIILYGYEGWQVVKTLYVGERILQSIRCLILIQCKDMRAGLIWENFRALMTASAGEWCTENETKPKLWCGSKCWDYESHHPNPPCSDPPA